MIVLELGPPPTAPLSINAERTMHWATRRDRVKPWRDLTWALALEQRLADTVNRRHAFVTVVLPVKGRHRRDPANYYPTVKAAVDGLVLAGVWPDDTAEFVTVTQPVLTTSGPAQIRIIPAELPGVLSPDPGSPSEPSNNQLAAGDGSDGTTHQHPPTGPRRDVEKADRP